MNGENTTTEDDAAVVTSAPTPAEAPAVGVLPADTEDTDYPF
jgi:hypothetical protein